MEITISLWPKWFLVQANNPNDKKSYRKLEWRKFTQQEINNIARKMLKAEFLICKTAKSNEIDWLETIQNKETNEVNSQVLQNCYEALMKVQDRKSYTRIERLDKTMEVKKWD